MRTASVLPAMGFAFLYLVLLRWAGAAEQDFPSGLLPEHIADFGLSPTRMQFIGYSLFVGGLGTACLLRLLRPAPRSPFRLSGGQATAIASVSTVVLFALGTTESSFWPGFVIGVLGLGALALRKSPRKVSKATVSARRWGRPTLLAVALVTWLAPLPLPLLVRDSIQLVQVDSHMAMTVEPGLELARGQSLHRTNYGLGMPLLIAAGARALAPLGLSAAGLLVTLVRLFQFMAAGLLGWLAWSLGRRSPTVAVILVLLVSGSLLPLDAAVAFPNQAGVRFLPLILGVVLLAWASRGALHPVPAGVATALLTVLSPEFGVATALGGVVLFQIRGQGRSGKLADGLRPSAWFLVAFLCLLPVFGRLSSGLVQVDLGDSGPFAFLLRFATGYGSQAELPSVLSVLMVFFASLALLHSSALAGQGRARSQASFDAALAVVMLVWLSYYVNRMHEWNLWFQGPLFVLALAPRLRTSLLPRLLRRRRPETLLAALAIATLCGFLSEGAAQWQQQASTLTKLIDAGCIDQLPPFAGLCVLGEGGGILLAERDALGQFAEHPDPIVLSLLPGEVRMAGLNQDFPWYEPFGEVPTMQDLERVAHWLDERGPETLFVEGPSSPLAEAVPMRARHLQRLTSKLTRYGQPVVDGPWLVFRRN